MGKNKKNTTLLASKSWGKLVILTKEEPILKVKKNSQIAKSLMCNPMVEIKKQ